MRPLQFALYKGETDLSVIAARYATAIIRAHGFEDFNKRTATFAADVFLRLNGLRLVLSDQEAKTLAELVERYAARAETIEADERQAANARRAQDEITLADFFRTHTAPL